MACGLARHRVARALVARHRVARALVNACRGVKQETIGHFGERMTKTGTYLVIGGAEHDRYVVKPVEEDDALLLEDEEDLSAANTLVALFGGEYWALLWATYGSTLNPRP